MKRTKLKKLKKVKEMGSKKRKLRIVRRKYLGREGKKIEIMRLEDNVYVKHDDS
jgi:hypothetical protein